MGAQLNALSKQDFDAEVEIQLQMTHAGKFGMMD